jgi:hypothetical protein
MLDGKRSSESGEGGGSSYSAPAAQTTQRDESPASTSPVEDDLPF